MIICRLRKVSSNNTKLCMNNVLSNIQLSKYGKLRDKNIHQHSHRVLPRCLYHSFIQQRKCDNEKHIQITMNNKLHYKHIMIGRSFGELRLSGQNYQMHQPKRYFGYSADVDPMIGSNAPIGRYESLINLLVNSAPVEFCQNTLLSLHSSTGLPWWATIVLVTCSLRTLVTLPFALYQQYILAKVANLKHEMDRIVPKLKLETNRAVDIYGWTETYARSVYNRSLKKQWNQLIVRENCHPMKGLILAIVQFPMWIILSASFRNLCFMLPRPTLVAHETFMQLSAEGFGWVSDLTAIDNYFILPVLLGIVNLTNIEVQILLKPKSLKQPTTVQKVGINIFRGISIMMVPIACVVPSCMSLYWVTSSAYGLAQSFILVSPRLRRFIRIPETETELKQPYKHFHDNVKEKYAWIYPNKLV